MVKFKKIGGGLFKYKGKYIAKGEVFEAKPSEISKAFSDVIIRVHPSGEEEETFPKQIGKYTIAEKAPGYYNVLEGVEILNDKGLRIKAAEALVEELIEEDEKGD